MVTRRMPFQKTLRCALTALAASLLAACSGAPTGFASKDTDTASTTAVRAGVPVNSSTTPDVVTDGIGSSDLPPAPIEHPTKADLALAGPLGDRFLGREDAPLTIIEYASLSCPHTRDFHAAVFDQVKKAYIDTGKVRWVLREFPIGHTSGAAWIVNRCVPEKDHFQLFDTFMRNQKEWVSLEVRRDAIAATAMRGQISQQQFDACWANPQVDAGLRWVKARGRQLGVTGTPTFFIGTTKIRAVPSFEDFSSIVEAELRAPGTGLQVAVAKSLAPPPTVQ